MAGDLALDRTTHEVRLCGAVVRLTSLEYRLLEELVRHAGHVLPTRLLVERVWGPEYGHGLHYVKGYVRRLRQKLGEADRPRRIQTVWGAGYRFTPVPQPLRSSTWDAQSVAGK